MFHPRFVGLCKLVHLVSLALWGGGASFFSYLTTPKIFSHLRDQLPLSPLPGVQGLTAEVGRRLAGDVVGTIFPIYFTFQAITGVLAVAAGVLLARHGQRLDKIRCGLVAVALGLVLFHVATVYPRSVRILDESYQAQDGGDSRNAEELRKTFGMWHGVSQLLNFMTIALVIAALVLASLTLRDPSRSVDPVRPLGLMTGRVRGV